jgi:hypothetical protein
MHDIPLTMNRGKPERTVLVHVAAIALLLAVCWTSKAVLRKQAFKHPTMVIGYWGNGNEQYCAAKRAFLERWMEEPAPAERMERRESN